MKILNAVVVALCACAIAVAPFSPSVAATEPTSVTDLLTQKHPFNGVFVPNTDSGLLNFQQKTGTTPNLIMFFKSWAEQTTFDPAEYNRVHSLGATPIIAWEPWDPSGNLTKQPAFQLRKIIAGRYDELIRGWAKGVASLGYPVMIRFAHEMNGHWYPWAVNSNGNRAGEYVKAWRHVHDIFTAEGATNAAWVWSPNINRFLRGVSLKALYPGNAYVDIVGVVGFASQKKESFDSVFASTFKEIRKFSKKKILISETGAQELYVNKPAWIKQFFAKLSQRSDIIGYVWFNDNKRADWKVTTSVASLNAFKAGIRAYLKNWKPSGIARKG